MTYKGKFQPQHPSKYQGDVTNIVYRSLWERNLFRWLDSHQFIKSWSSEEVVIPYRCKTDGRIHRYFPDVKFEFGDGRVMLIEVKPKRETVEPRIPKKRTKRFLLEVMTYAKNVSKWEAAMEYAKDRGWIFEIWDEDMLRKLGITILGTYK